MQKVCVIKKLNKVNEKSLKSPEIIAVVKGNAYGMGLVQYSRILIEHFNILTNLSNIADMTGMMIEKTEDSKNVTIFDFDSNIYYAMYTTDGNNTYTSIDTDDGEFAVLELDEKIYLMDEENSKYYPLESVPDAIADTKADIEMYFSGTYKGKGDIGEWYISESAETAEIVTINGKDFLFTFDVAGNIHDIIRPELNEYGEKREVSISYEPEAVDIYLYIPSYYELMTEKEYMTYIEKMPK